MTEEDLKAIEVEMELLTNKGKDWQLIMGRNQPERWDIISGPPIKEVINMVAQLTDEHKHIAHFHSNGTNPPMNSPAQKTTVRFKELNFNINDGKFLAKTPELVRAFISEVRKLNEEIKQLKGE